MNLELAYKPEVLIALLEGPPANHLGGWKEQESVGGLRGEGEPEHWVELSVQKGQDVSLPHCFFPLSKCRSGSTVLSKPAWAPCPVSGLGSIFCGWLSSCLSLVLEFWVRRGLWDRLCVSRWESRLKEGRQKEKSCRKPHWKV